MDSAVLLGLVVAIITPLVTAAVSFGAIRAQSRNTAESISDLKASIGRFGERLGGVEAEVRVMRAVDRERRRSYVGVVQSQVPPSEDESE
jgi:hypothetical protein